MNLQQAFLCKIWHLQMHYDSVMNKVVGFKYHILDSQDIAYDSF